MQKIKQNVTGMRDELGNMIKDKEKWLPPMVKKLEVKTLTESHTGGSTFDDTVSS